MVFRFLFIISVITSDLSKWQVPDVDPRTKQQISFIGNLNKAGNTNTFLFKRSKRNYNRFKYDSKNYNKFLAEIKRINLLIRNKQIYSKIN